MPPASNEASRDREITVRGRKIDFQDGHLICLDDLWSAAGFTKTKRPSEWYQLAMIKSLHTAVLERVTGKKKDWTKEEQRSVYQQRTAKDGKRKTFADVRMALAYAEFLHPALGVEVREIFLRYRGADPILADDILERSSAEANLWAGQRAMSRSVRKSYTDVLKEHGVSKGYEFANCTNEAYKALFGGTAKQIREKRGLPKSANIRDNMSYAELAYTIAAEALSAERIEEEQRLGYQDCKSATGLAAKAIGNAIEADRNDRQARMLD